ncbi:polysaccharide deacetylase family protein [Paenibacillus sp. TH7-28]
MVSEGHALGNHSWSHRNLAKISEKEMREEITKTDEAINEVVGFVPVLMRPPYGMSIRVIGTAPPSLTYLRPSSPVLRGRSLS